MSDLNKRALRGLFGFMLMIALCIFLPAWTFDYWQAWVLVSLLFVSLLGITLYLMNNDQRLLERRLAPRPRKARESAKYSGQ